MTETQLAADAPLPPLPHGFFYRRIVILPEGEHVRAAVEDELHHMELHLFHDGRAVTAIQGISHRYPWSECPAAPAHLQQFVGMPLRPMHQSTGLDAREHCTHLFDLARLAMSQALANAPVQYDISVEDRVEDRTTAEVLRNGKSVLRWEIEGLKITAPELFAGQLITGKPQWPAGLDQDTVEAALILKRVFPIASGRDPAYTRTRDKRLGNFKFMEAMQPSQMESRCYNFHVGRFERVHYRQSWLNYDGRRDELLKNFPGVRTVAQLQSGSP